MFVKYRITINKCYKKLETNHIIEESKRLF